MRKFLLVFLLAGIALPASAVRRVTVDELDQLLTAANGKPDAKIAQQLSELELSERLSATRFSKLDAALPGPESRRSLMVLADVSAFLDLPATEIPAAAPPDLAAQRQMIALTMKFTGKTIAGLPNFFATRDTISFQDTPQGYRANMSAIPYQPLREVGRSSDTMLYRDGREVVDSTSAKDTKSEPAAHGLTTTGVFGPILGRVLVDAVQGGKLSWSHWEQGADGSQAVFRYTVPRENSHYQVEYCCVFVDGASRVFQQFSGYHGLIATDPVSGAILRVTLEADLKRSDPLVRSDILVEYSRVEIGGKTYVCPVKSVSISLAPALPSNTFEIQLYRNTLVSNNQAREHLQTLLNDVVFAHYHLFRAEARVLSAERVTNTNPEPTAPEISIAETNGLPESISTLKERFQQVIQQQADASEITVSANTVVAASGAALKLNIATNNLALKQQDDRWMDKLDIFLVQRDLVQRDGEGQDAPISGQTLSLALKSSTYERLLKEGIPFDEIVRSKQDTGSVRIVIVDENSGRMGSVTLPAAALQGKR